MDATLLEQTHKYLESDPDVALALGRYAKELGVSVDHVIMGSLRMVAEEYNRATGDGMIPALG